MVKVIRQKVVLDALPEKVYDAIMDSKKHSAFTGDKAIISRKEGGKFSVFSGYATGKNIKLIPGKKIVQTWTTTDLPKGYQTEITYSLKKQNDKTVLEFKQTNVPNDRFADLSKGWKDYYWAPLKKMLKNKA